MNYRNFISALSIILLMVACADQPSQPKLVYPNKVNYESFIIAKHMGYLSDFEVITVKSGINSAEAVMLGEVDLAAMGNGPAVILLSKNKHASIVTRYAKGTHIHRLITQTTIRSIDELKGKKVGVQVGSSTHAALVGYLQAYGLSEKDVELVSMLPTDMPEAMKNNYLDAIAGSEPWGVNVENLCGDKVHEIGFLSDENNQSPHVLVGKNRLLKNKPEYTQVLLKALDNANQFINEQPEQAAEIAAQYIGLSPSDELKCLQRLKWKIGWDNDDETALKNTSNFFYKTGRIKLVPDRLNPD